MNKIHPTYTNFIHENKEGCLAKINNQIVIIKKVKTFKWSAIVIYSPCNLHGFKIVKLSRLEPIKFYT